MFNHCTCPPDGSAIDPRCPKNEEPGHWEGKVQRGLVETSDERDHRLDRERSARMDRAKDAAGEGAEHPIEKFRRVFASE